MEGKGDELFNVEFAKKYTITLHSERLLPKCIIRWEANRERNVTLRIEGLRYDLSEGKFMERFARLRDGRFERGQFGINGVQFDYTFREAKAEARSAGHRD